jgi:predicted transcriptional regulator
MSLPQSKLTDEQRVEIVERHGLGETMSILAKEFGVSLTTVSKYVRKAAGKSQGQPQEQRSTPATAIRDFAKRARSIIWRQDGKDKTTYDKWQVRITELEKGGLNNKQAIVQASKDFPCLEKLFREYDVGEFDPHPESHPRIHMHGKPAPMDGIENEEREQSHRENLSWAIDAAGKFLRTGEAPISTPNDAAYYLYRQACEEPKDFLGKYTQIEAKGGDDLEEQRQAKRSGKRAIDEIDEMLSELDTWVDGASLEESEAA